jgi:hypothetical protein
MMRTVISILQVFQRNFIYHFCLGVRVLSSKEDDKQKSGLKLGLGYMLKSSAKKLKGLYLCQDNDAKANDIVNFEAVLELKWDQLFGDAEYAVVMSRQDRLRKPVQLPNELDIVKVLLFIYLLLFILFIYF